MGNAIKCLCFSVTILGVPQKNIVSFRKFHHFGKIWTKLGDGFSPGLVGRT